MVHRHQLDPKYDRDTGRSHLVADHLREAEAHPHHWLPKWVVGIADHTTEQYFSSKYRES